VSTTSERGSMTRFIPIIVAILAVLILVTTDFGRSGTVVYDCRDAHWHPDYPIEVKKQCREIMKEHYEKEQEKRKMVIT